MDFFNEKELDIINNISSAILYCKNDEFFTILYANQYFYNLIGYTKEEVKSIFSDKLSKLIIDDISFIFMKIKEIIDSGENLNIEYRLRRKDNSVIWIHENSVYNKEENAFYVTLMDITHMKTIEYQKDKLNNYLDNITNKVIITDINGIIEYKNKEAESDSTYPKIGSNIKDYIKDNIVGYYGEGLWQMAKINNGVEYETRIKINNKFITHDRNALVPIKNEFGQVCNLMQVSENIMRNGDLLTHFPDRAMLKEYYERVKLFIEDSTKIYFALIDIDKFKNLNDIYGHIFGDKIIEETANRIASIISKKDYVCRYGGDEFIILFIEENEENVIKKLQHMSEMSVINKELKGINLTYSIGVSNQISNSLSYLNLVNLADKALYKVKRYGRNNICLSSDFRLVNATINNNIK